MFIFLQLSSLSGYIRMMINSMDTVRASSEHRVSQALVVIAKMIQMINLYEQMLELQRVFKNT